MFSPAPQGAVRVLDGDTYGVTVRTISGQILCRENSEEYWIPSVVTQELMIESCDQFTTAFSPLTHPPQDLLDCAAFRGRFVEGIYTVLFAIYQQGNIWKWQEVSSAYAVLVYLGLALKGGAPVPWLAAPFGLCAGCGQSEYQATEYCFPAPARHSDKSLVFPDPAGADSKVKGPLRPDSSCCISRGRSTKLDRTAGK